MDFDPIYCWRSGDKPYPPLWDGDRQNFPRMAAGWIAISPSPQRRHRVPLQRLRAMAEATCRPCATWVKAAAETRIPGI